jgi:hypothetical protein
MRAAQSQATNLANNAAGTSAGYGTDAVNIGSTLTPFLTRELNNPQGISQPDQTAMLSAAEGGAGGVAGGLQTGLDQRAAATGNASGFAGAADDIARERMKAAAGESSAIAAKNAGVKEEQRQAAASGLRGMYGTDVSAQLGAMGVQNNAINTSVNAGSHGWFQNMTNLIASIRGGGMSPGAMPGGGGGGGSMGDGSWDMGSGGDVTNMGYDDNGAMTLGGVGG